MMFFDDQGKRKHPGKSETKQLSTDVRKASKTIQISMVNSPFSIICIIPAANNSVILIS